MAQQKKTIAAGCQWCKLTPRFDNIDWWESCEVMELSADTLRATSWEVWCSWRVFVVQSVSVVFVCDCACHERLGQARAPVAAGEDRILVCPCYKMFEDVAHVCHVSIADDFTWGHFRGHRNVRARLSLIFILVLSAIKDHSNFHPERVGSNQFFDTRQVFASGNGSCLLV